MQGYLVRREVEHARIPAPARPVLHFRLLGGQGPGCGLSRILRLKAVGGRAHRVSPSAEDTTERAAVTKRGLSGGSDRTAWTQADCTEYSGRLGLLRHGSGEHGT